MKVDFQIEGMDELNRVLKNLPGKAKEATAKEIERSALDLQGKSQMLAPVDKGDLRGSAFTEVEGTEATIGYTEPYATRQHEETSYRHPKGGQAKFLEEPFKQNAKKYVENIGNAIKKAVEK